MRVQILTTDDVEENGIRSLGENLRSPLIKFLLKSMIGEPRMAKKRSRLNVKFSVIGLTSNPSLSLNKAKPMVIQGAIASRSTQIPSKHITE